MKTILSSLLILSLLSIASCGGKEESKQKDKITIGNSNQQENIQSPKSASTEITTDLNNKGIGPIKNVSLSESIDNALALQGQELYKTKCTACHKPDKRFIGPAPTGIMERRSPEWIMNMILNPEQMVKEDPIAKQLLIEYNGSPMANQSLTEEEARAILEYFRTL